MPRAERERIELNDELYGYLDQSNISGKNRERLEELRMHEDQGISALAGLIDDIARVHPRRRRRELRIAASHPDLFDRMAMQLGEGWWDRVLTERYRDRMHDWLRDRWRLSQPLPSYAESDAIFETLEPLGMEPIESLDPPEDPFGP